MLLPPRSTTVVPVSCLEAGRWATTPSTARPAEHVHFASGRANKLRSVTERLCKDGTFYSDQGTVWEDIRRKFAAEGAYSPTAAEADYLDARRERVEELRRPISPQPSQVGAVFGAGQRIVGVDLFLAPKLYANLHEKLLISHLLDVADDVATTPPSTANAMSKIRALFAGQPERFPAPGAGESFRWSSESGSAAALFADGKCVHAVGFCSEPQADADEMVAA